MDEDPPKPVDKTGALPLSPSLQPSLVNAHVPPPTSAIDGRVVVIAVWAIVLGLAGGLIAQTLKYLIGFFTNLAFYGRVSFEFVSPAGHSLGVWVIGVPVVGGLIVGFMARFGSRAIRGHGIPEAMEQILRNQSRIPARITWLKPLSSAIAIGTGGPFGAEGPIIATGGALGSLFGQIMKTSAAERKTLLAAGAAAGMAATFGSPVAAVLLSIELLLFEYRPRSIIPVALASTVATGVHIALEGAHAVFPMPQIQQPSGAALAAYLVVGALSGFAAIAVTRIVYAIEDAFEKLPINWMWWPAIGAVAVGVVGFFAPGTLGVGYDNISEILSGSMSIKSIAFLCAMKFISWSISLGSGTSGGTLAPLFTIGGGFGALLGALAANLFPGAEIDPRVAALVGMASIFAGASRAFLASAVFAFETTLQPMGLLPLLGGCTAAYFVSCGLMRQSIMTEKIARRGVRVPSEYLADPLDSISVGEVASKGVVSLRAGDTIDQLRHWLAAHAAAASHQGFPVLNDEGHLTGVITRRDLLAAAESRARTVSDLIRRPAVAVYEDCTLREAADHMVNHNVGRLPVLSRTRPPRLVGIISRSDILSAYKHRIAEGRPSEPVIKVFRRDAKSPQ